MTRYLHQAQALLVPSGAHLKNNMITHCIMLACLLKKYSFFHAMMKLCGARLTEEFHKGATLSTEGKRLVSMANSPSQNVFVNNTK